MYNYIAEQRQAKRITDYVVLTENLAQESKSVGTTKKVEITTERAI